MKVQIVSNHDDRETMKLYADNKCVGYYSIKSDTVFAYDKDGYAVEIGNAWKASDAIDAMRNHLNA